MKRSLPKIEAILESEIAQYWDFFKNKSRMVIKLLTILKKLSNLYKILRSEKQNMKTISSAKAAYSAQKSATISSNRCLFIY